MSWFAVSPNVLWVLGINFGILAIATIIAFLFLPLIKPQKDFTELKTRIKSWWVMIGLFTGAIVFGRSLTVAFFGFISYFAFKEYLSLIPTRRPDVRVLGLAYLSIPLHYYWVSIGWYGMFLVFVTVYVFSVLPARMMLIGETSGFLNAVGTIYWGLMLSVFGLSHAAYLIILPQGGSSTAGGVGLLVYLIFLTEINDVSQYVWGKLFGKNKIVPKISPKKTREGFMGGVVTTIMVAWLLAPILTPLNLLESLFAGLLIGVSGFVGDVTMSMFKRDIGVKDSGNLIPGHGGILDRIDSLTFTAPLFFHFVNYTHYGTHILSSHLGG